MQSQQRTGVAPIDELRILYRYAGSLNVTKLYARMEELAEQIGYGRRYHVALREADAKADDAVALGRERAS